MEMKIQIAEKLCFLLTENKRFKVVHGGRGASRSWGFTDALLYKIVTEPTKPKRILCTRELQNSIKDSVHRLISDRIAHYGLSHIFQVLDNEIRCSNGSVFLFKGLRSNASEIKSLEGIDICWVEEAHKVSKASWDYLTPTIRKDDSEIWVSFNTAYGDTYDMFVEKERPDAIVVHMTFADNPWFPEVLRREMEYDKAHDPARYEHVWLGKPQGYQGLVYPQYSKDVHEIDFDYNYLPQCDLYMSIDPHRKYYPAITWYAVTPTSAVIVYNEWPKFEDLGMWYDEARNVRTFEITVDELANAILANDLTLYGGKIKARVGDPRFLNENPDLVVALMSNGVHGWTEAPFERIETQRENLKSLMAYNPAIPLGGSNLPDWYVSKKCRNKSRSYQRHSYDEEKDKECETHKDFIDNDRYFLSLFPSGRPIYRGPESVVSTGTVKSLASLQMQSRPAQGYFSPVKK